MLHNVPVTKASAMLTCRVLADSLNVVFFVIVSRLLGPEGIGVYSYGFAVAAFVFAASSLGIEQYGVREYQRASSRARNRILSELLGLQIAVGFIVSLVLIAFLLLTNASPLTATAVFALSAYQLCSAIAITLYVPAVAAQEMVRPAVIALLTRGFAFVVAALVLIRSSSLGMALLAFPLMSLVHVFTGIQSLRTHKVRIRLTPAVAPLLKSARVMRSFATVDALAQIIPKTGVVVLTLVAGERLAGIYATGLKFIEVAFLPLWFLGVAVYPRLCRTRLELSPEFAKLARMLLFAAVAMTLIVVATVWWLVPPLLVPVLGPAFDGAQPAIAAMVSIASLYGVEIALGRILYAHGLQHVRATAMTAGAAACVVLSALAAPRMGIAGVIVATALAYVVIDLWYALAARRERRAIEAGHGNAIPRETPGAGAQAGTGVRVDI